MKNVYTKEYLDTLISPDEIRELYPKARKKMKDDFFDFKEEVENYIILRFPSESKDRFNDWMYQYEKSKTCETFTNNIGEKAYVIDIDKYVHENNIKMMELAVKFHKNADNYYNNFVVKGVDLVNKKYNLY